MIVPLLASIMFMMGLTLTREDAARIALDPRPVAVGVALQFLLMPILALTLAKLLQLSTPLTVGMVLVGSCAGGTASNVICFLARGDVALSVSMTLISTLIGVVATPLLSQFYLAEQVDVDEMAMIKNLLQIVFAPVLIGFGFRALLPRVSAALQPVLPLFSVICILLIIGIVVALNAPQLRGVRSTDRPSRHPPQRSGHRRGLHLKPALRIRSYPKPNHRDRGRHAEFRARGGAFATIFFSNRRPSCGYF
jgi:BASS family bile acid:Na+ symporter